MTAPPVEVSPFAADSSPPSPADSSPPSSADPSPPPAALASTRPRPAPRPDQEPASSEKRTELDLPKVADFVSDEDAIPTTSPTPRLLGRVTPIALPRARSLQRAAPIVLACIVAACIVALSWAYAARRDRPGGDPAATEEHAATD